MKIPDLNTLLTLSYTPRWVIVPMLREQTVSDHSWRVAIIAFDLVTKIRALGYWYLIPSAVLEEAIFHDAEEAGKGDTPSTIKATPDFRSMGDNHLIVKAADYIEQAGWASAWAHPAVKNKVTDHITDRLSRLNEEVEARMGKAAVAVIQVLLIDRMEIV